MVAWLGASFFHVIGIFSVTESISCPDTKQIICSSGKKWYHLQPWGWMSFQRKASKGTILTWLKNWTDVFRKSSLEVDENWINWISNWILSNISNYLSPSIQSNHNFSNWMEQILNKSSIWKIWLHPIVGVKSNRSNFELSFIECFEYFLPFLIKFSNRIKRISNEFQLDSTPSLLHF